MPNLIVCRCEEVTLDEIENTAQKYQCSAREIKLRTRAGMGYCAGRTCRTAIDAIIENISGQRIQNEIPLKVQPPIRPISLTTLGSKVKR